MSYEPEIQQMWVMVREPKPDSEQTPDRFGRYDRGEWHLVPYDDPRAVAARGALSRARRT